MDKEYKNELYCEMKNYNDTLNKGKEEKLEEFWDRWRGRDISSVVAYLYLEIEKLKDK